MRPVDLRSDTATRPTAEMRHFMANAPVGDDQIGEDPTVNELQNAVAELLGKEAAMFLPSTTMANQIAFNILARPGEEVLLEETSHPIHFEAGGLAFHSGLMVHPIPGVRGVFQPEQVEKAIRPKNPHFSRSACLSVENTHNIGGGTIWPLETLNAVCNIAGQHGLALHLDGSRLLNAVVASGISAQTYAAPFDSVALCFTKGLGAPVGSCLAGSQEFVNEEVRWRKHRFGGAMRQAGIIAAGALYALRHNVDRLTEDHANAQKLASGLANISTIDIEPGHVDTNLVFFNIARTGLSVNEALAQLKENGVLVASTLGEHRIRAVTHLDVSTKDIDVALKAFSKVFGH